MGWINRLTHRRLSCSRPAESDEQLAEEIRYHLDIETSRQVRSGCDPAMARLRALALFGDPGWIMDATRRERGTHTTEIIMHDLRSAIRSLRKHSAFTLLAIITLGLGIGATAAAFTVLDTVLLKPLPYRNAGQLVLLAEHTADGSTTPASFPNFVDWRAQAQGFSGVASEMFPFAQTVTAATGPVRATIMGVSRNFFATLGVTPILGREFAANEEAAGGPPAIMVSYEFWKTQMNGRTALGTILIGDQATAVVGVAPRGFRFVDDADLYFPHEQWPGTCRSCHNYRVVARLAPGATLAGVRREMATVSHALLQTYGHDTQAVGVDISGLTAYLVGGYQVMLLVVFGAAALVLLIACTNLVTAQLARGMSRGREMAVRTALGASRARLVRQLLFESALLALAGALLGTVFAIGITWIVRLLGTGLVRRLDELHVDGRVLLFTIAVSGITALLIGLYPALRVAGGNTGQMLHGTRGSSGAVRGLVWRILVGFEIAMAVILLVGSVLLIRTLHNILSANTGFAPRGVVTVALVPGDTVDLALFGHLRDELAALPGVQGVAFTNHLPLDWSSTAGPVRRPTDPIDRDWPAMAGFRVVSSEYFGVLQQPILRGRSFGTADAAGAAHVAIITPGIAQKLWPGQNPVGKQIATNYLVGQTPTNKWVDDWLTVVGVAAEASSWTMPPGEQNEIYVPLAQHPTNTEGSLTAVMRTRGDPHAMIPAVRNRLRTLVPTMPPQLGTLDDRIARSAADRRFAMVALTLFGAIALLLAGIGIYGTMSYIVAARTHDIGVRMALGATPAGVLGHVLLDAVTMAVGGIVVGTVAAVFVTRYLQATLYGVSHVELSAYGTGAAILLITALLGAYIPARRSSRVDPLLAIRTE